MIEHSISYVLEAAEWWVWRDSSWSDRISAEEIHSMLNLSKQQVTTEDLLSLQKTENSSHSKLKQDQTRNIEL